MDEEIVSFTDELYKKCKSSSIEQVEKMLFSSNTEVYTYEDCLINAVQGENFELIEYFIENYPPRDYTLSGIMATKIGNIPLVMRFVRLGANVDDVISHTSRYEILKVLLHPDVSYSNLIDSLRRVCKHGDILGARLILSLLRNANFGYYRSHFGGCSNLALEYNHPEIIETLFIEGKCDFSYGYSLDDAVKSGNIILVDRVLNNSSQSSYNITRARDLAIEMNLSHIKTHLDKTLKTKHNQEMMVFLGFLFIVCLYILYKLYL